VEHKHPSHMPDVHGGATLEAAAATTVLIYLLSLAGVAIPGEVGAAIVTLMAGAFGFLRGSRFRTNRRIGDTGGT